MSADQVFGAEYAGHYDLFYADKNYAAECDFLEEVFRRYSPEPVHSILDLGCGTGGHALLLARRGYQVAGVDRSEAMLVAARAKAAACHVDSRLTFHQGDIRTLDLGQTYDVVIAMFAVMSYMTANADLAAALNTIRHHLRPGGLLVFDAWFGPGVLSDRPAVRYKVVQAGDERAFRFVQPTLDVVTQTVDVSYKVMRIHGDRIVEETDEVHAMRFFFAQEVDHHLHCAGFRLLNLCPFLELDADLGEHVWNMTAVAEATTVRHAVTSNRMD